MTADFSQTDRNGKVLTGKLTLKQPGRVRFQYGQGVPILIGAAVVGFVIGEVRDWEFGSQACGWRAVMEVRTYLKLSVAVAIATILLKTGAWWLTGSVSLLSDAMESLVNLAGALFALTMVALAGLLAYLLSALAVVVFIGVPPVAFAHDSPVYLIKVRQGVVPSGKRCQPMAVGEYETASMFRYCLRR